MSKETLFECTGIDRENWEAIEPEIIYESGKIKYSYFPPANYKNVEKLKNFPIKKDALKCQLCETDILYPHAVVSHKHKLWAYVGSDCIKKFIVGGEAWFKKIGSMEREVMNKSRLSDLSYLCMSLLETVSDIERNYSDFKDNLIDVSSLIDTLEVLSQEVTKFAKAAKSKDNELDLDTISKLRKLLHKIYKDHYDLIYTKPEDIRALVKANREVITPKMIELVEKDIRKFKKMHAEFYKMKGLEISKSMKIHEDVLSMLSRFRVVLSKWHPESKENLGRMISLGEKFTIEVENIKKSYGSGKYLDEFNIKLIIEIGGSFEDISKSG